MPVYDRPGAERRAEAARKRAEAERHKARGNQCYLADDFEAALLEYEAAAALVPTSPVYATNAAQACLRLARYRDAADAALRAVALDPRYAKAPARAGLALMRLGRLAEARVHYSTALALDPRSGSLQSEVADLGHAETWAKSLEAALAGKKWQAALEAADAGLRYSPASSNILLSRVRALGGLRRFVDAVAQCRTLTAPRAAFALEPCAPSLSHVHQLEADALYQSGDMEGAEQALLASLRLDPDSAPCIAALRRVRKQVRVCLVTS